MDNLLKGIFIYEYEVETCASPVADIYETDGEIVFEIEMPGMYIKNIRAMVLDNLLVIEGIRINDEDELSGELKYLCMERCLKRFRRVLKIPVHVNTEKADAYYNNGILILKFPKLKDKLIKIEIKTNN